MLVTALPLPEVETLTVLRVAELWALDRDVAFCGKAGT